MVWRARPSTNHRRQRRHFDGAFRFASGSSRNLDFGLKFDYGLDKGSRNLAADQPDPDNGDVYGAGFTLNYAKKLSPEFSMGFSLETLIYSIPYVEYSTCTAANCAVPFTVVEKERERLEAHQANVTRFQEQIKQLERLAGY